MAWNETTQEQYRRPMATNETDLTDGEWAFIEPLLPVPSRMGHRHEMAPRFLVTVSRFLKMPMGIKEEQGLVSLMIDDLRSALMAKLPDFGCRMAQRVPEPAEESGCSS